MGPKNLPCCYVGIKGGTGVHRPPKSLPRSNSGWVLAPTWPYPMPCPNPQPGSVNSSRIKGGMGATTTVKNPLSSPCFAEGRDGAPTHYESLLDNLDFQCPELAGECQDRVGEGAYLLGPQQHDFLDLSEELRWLSGLPATSNGQRRRIGTRRGHREQGPPSRSRRVTSLSSRT